MGNPARGASLGRSSSIPDDTEKPVKMHLRRIRLDSGGYDPGGAYWGHGGWLWEAWSDDGETYLTGRAMSRPFRDKAKAEILEIVPKARFYR